MHTSMKGLPPECGCVLNSGQASQRQVPTKVSKRQVPTKAILQLTSETNPLQLSPNIRSPLIFHVPTSMKKVFKRPNILHMCLVHVHFVILHLLLVYMHKCSMPIAWHFWSLNVWNKICSSWSLQTSKTNILPM